MLSFITRSLALLEEVMIEALEFGQVPYLKNMKTISCYMSHNWIYCLDIKSESQLYQW